MIQWGWKAGEDKTSWAMEMGMGMGMGKENNVQQMEREEERSHLRLEEVHLPHLIFQTVHHTLPSQPPGGQLVLGQSFSPHYLLWDRCWKKYDQLELREFWTGTWLCTDSPWWCCSERIFWKLDKHRVCPQIKSRDKDL
jgi:hypothetical protein